jgi:acetyl-CoA carboxylase beta subunit
MNASNSYAVLLADAIAINGTVNATNAIVAAGNFTFDNGSGAMTSAGKAATALQMFTLNTVSTLVILAASKPIVLHGWQ